jgi:prepilin-type processing-associated H-X9-DG protein
MDPADRRIDRMLAARGELEDAAPLFAAGRSIPRVGALLAVPLLVASGVFEDAEGTFGNIGPAFYGLRTTLLTLLLLALLRVKRPENLKEYSPTELGRILGLDRAPEVKTIRRKLSRMGDDDNCLTFLGKLVSRRIGAHNEALGFLYVDGHVRVYHGEVDLPRTHAARLRLSVPATQDVWINDADGLPVLVVTQEAHPSLTSALRTMLADVRTELGGRRATVVFDRGGWSPQLFKWMETNGFDVLTYRKGDSTPVPEAEFTRHVIQLPRGIVVYELSDTIITLADGFQMRQVTRRQGAHQTNIVTTRRDLLATDVAQRMFDRWRQENFFKYMREQYAIDALLEYGTEPADPTRDMPNPAWTRLEKQRRLATKKLHKAEAQYGAAVVDDATAGVQGTDALGAQVREARAEQARIAEERDKLPRRRLVVEVKGEALRLPRGRKQLSDGLKMLAYQAETDLARLVAPHYLRSLDEGRRLIAAALQSTGDIEPADGILHITLAPQSSPHRTRAIAELCLLLTATNTHFPGTNLRVSYTVRDV